MTTKRIYQGIVSMGLAAALFLTAAFPVSAAEIPEETVVESQIAQAVPETMPPETTAPETEPPETAAPTVPETEPPETTVPATQPTEVPTVPQTTEPASVTQPTETAETGESTIAPTEETVPQPAESPAVPNTVEAAEAVSEPTETSESEVPDSQSVQVMTIDEAWKMPVGTEGLTIQGTVVFVSGSLAVLQDSTNGIRLSFPQDPGAVVGEILRVTGIRSGGIAVADFESMGMGALPAVETTLLDASENLRVKIANAVIKNNQICQNGFSLTLDAALPASAIESGSVDAYGVILDGIFYADSIAPGTASGETDPEGQTAWNTYFGQLHAHTSVSDGTGTVTEAFEYAANVEGLDFFAVTDHSDSFDNAAFGSIGIDGTAVSMAWAEGKAAAAAVTDETFVGIFGYEMSWPEEYSLGHINTFNTPGWQAWGQSGFDTLESYYKVLDTVPGAVSQFNHPSHFYGNFHKFADYDPAYDKVVHLLEVGSSVEDGLWYYNKALDEGWHVAPSNNQNNHEGSWGDASDVRTVVLAAELTEASLYEAMRSYRVYATEDRDLRISYSLNGHIMGSVIGTTDRLTVQVSLQDPTDTAIGTVEMIADGGESVAVHTVAASSGELNFDVPTGYSYYYLRVTQSDGDIAVTAPVWVDQYEDMGITGFTCDTQKPMEDQEVTLTLELFNEETAAFVLDKLEFFEDNTLIHEISAPGTVNALSDLSYRFPFTWPDPGEVKITAKVTGNVEGRLRTYETTLILHYQAKEASVSTIAEARIGILGNAYRVKGYVTAGNDNPYTTFPNMLYLQDDTGGIAVSGYLDAQIQVGRPMEVTGVLRELAGNRILDLTEYTLPEENYYRYTPRTMAHEIAMNYDVHGGELLQIEGTVVSLTKTFDGKGISRLTLKDVRGDLATVIVDAGIRSGAYGTNELATKIKKGRTVRAIGLLHVDEYGETVLRVRNCDEVVYVPATADPSNPKTGDLFAAIGRSLLSGTVP